MPERLAALNEWLASHFEETSFTLARASEDASFRRYFRISLEDGQTLIAMDAPPEKEDCTPFVEIAGQLLPLGIHVPEIHAHSPDQGFLLLSDLGETLYLDQLDEGNVDRLYGDALGALAAMQACADSDRLPRYDRQLLWDEMELFRHWLLGEHLQLSLSEAEQELLTTSFQALVANARRQPQVFVHRDYHSRNLMLTQGRNPGVLDFQDAVAGPVTYDLVSLLKDCYIRWPRQRVNEWAMGYFHLALHTGIVREEHEREFLAWFDLMGMQRHLKAAGIFARLYHRDGKDGYLKDIPRTLGYITEVAPDYPESKGLGEFIARRVLPALAS
jgi:aminoglycoside/choline kinase family phosphotransferase